MVYNDCSALREKSTNCPGQKLSSSKDGNLWTVTNGSRNTCSSTEIKIRRFAADNTETFQLSTFSARSVLNVAAEMETFWPLPSGPGCPASSDLQPHNCDLLWKPWMVVGEHPSWSAGSELLTPQQAGHSQSLLHPLSSPSWCWFGLHKCPNELSCWSDICVNDQLNRRCW